MKNPSYTTLTDVAYNGAQIGLSTAEGAIKDVLATIAPGLSSDLNFQYAGLAPKQSSSSPATPYNSITNPNCADEKVECFRNTNMPTLDEGNVYVTGGPSMPGVIASTKSDVFWSDCVPGGSYAENDVQLAVVYVYQRSSASPWTADLEQANRLPGQPPGTLSRPWLQGTLLHEFGHVIGWPDFSGPFGYPWDLLEWSANSPESRMVWEHDYSSSRAVPYCPGQQYYSGSTNYLKHLVSFDEGQSWTEVSDDGTLNATTNARPAAAWGETIDGERYVLAWARSEDGRIVSIVGDGYTWNASTRVLHSGANAQTMVGVSLAYGNGMWVLVWAGPDTSPTFRGRPIFYQSSLDGVEWTEPIRLEYPDLGGDEVYGTLFTPTVRFVGDGDGKFVLLFQNWYTAAEGTWTTNLASHIDELSRVRACVSDNPMWLGFGDCRELEFGAWMSTTWSSPGLACRPDSNECIVTGTDHVPRSGVHRLWNASGAIDIDGKFTLTTTSGYYQTISSALLGWNTRQEISSVWSGSKWMMAAAADGEPYSGFKSSATPSTVWTGREIISDDIAWSAPELAWAEPWWSEVSVFFGGR